MKKFLIISILVSLWIPSFGQKGSVGIGVDTPNRNAVLHLSAPENNQGILVPRLTSDQKRAFAAQLTFAENGMLIFDSDDNQFYYWVNDHWQVVGFSFQVGSGLSIVDGIITNAGDPDESDDFSGEWSDLANIPAGFQDAEDNFEDADSNPTNELQDLHLTGNVLSITGITSPTNIDLSVISGTGLDEQDLQFSGGQITLSGDPDATIIDLSNYDTDASDDFTTGDETDPTVPASIKDGIDWTELSNVPTGFIDNSDDVNDADADPSNELQVITTDNTPGNITLSDDKTLSINVNDADDNPVNELQDLDLTNNILTITGIGSPNPIDLSPYSGTNTDSQNLQFSSGLITLSGDPDNTIIDLSNYDTNAGDDFTTGDETDPTVPANIKDGIDWTELSGVPAGFGDNTDDVNDNDADPANELQDLRFSSGQITLSGDPGNTIIDLSNYDTDATDDFTNADETDPTVPANIKDGIDWTELSGVPAGFGDDTDDVNDNDADPANELQDLQFSSGQITLSGDPGNTIIDLSNYDTDAADDFTNADETDPTVPANIKDGIDWTELSGVPAGFGDDTDDVNDNDADPANELQDLNLSGNILTITGLTTPTDIDLSPFSGSNTDEQDLQFNAGLITLSGDPDNTIIDLSNYDTNAGDDFTTGDETDPTVPANIKDGIDWTELSGVPAGFGDNTDDVNDNDADPANELQDLQFSSGQITLSGDPGNTIIDLSNYDTNAADDFTTGDETDPTVPANIKDGIDWTELSGVPAGFADDTDDVDDGDTNPNNELQNLFLTGDILDITDRQGPGSVDLSPYKDNTDEQDLSLSTNILSLSGDPTTVNLSGYLDNTDEQDLTLIGNTLAISGDPNTDVDLSAYLDNTDNQTVDQFNITANTINLSLENDGLPPLTIDLSPYLDNTDEQNLSLASNTLSLTGDATTVDLAGYLDSPWIEDTDGVGNFISYTGRTKSINQINTPLGITDIDIIGGALSSSGHKIVIINASSPATIYSVDTGLDGQEVMIISSGSGSVTLQNNLMNGSNLFLPTNMVVLNQGASITLMYIADLAGWITVNQNTTVTTPN